MKNRHLRVATETLVEMFKAGKSMQKIADEVGLAKTTVYWRLLRAGVDTRRKLKDVGCPKCQTHPYSNGLCRACYVMKRRRDYQAAKLLKRMDYRG